MGEYHVASEEEAGLLREAIEPGIARAVQDYCAAVAARDPEEEIPGRVQGTFWNKADVERVAELLSTVGDPFGLLDVIDGGVVLRQMRDSGLLEEALKGAS